MSENSTTPHLLFAQALRQAKEALTNLVIHLHDGKSLHNVQAHEVFTTGVMLVHTQTENLAPGVAQVRTLILVEFSSIEMIIFTQTILEKVEKLSILKNSHIKGFTRWPE